MKKSLVTLILILCSSILLPVSIFGADDKSAGKTSIPLLVKNCGPAVVMIFNQDGDKVTGIGSGFIADSKGTVITNFHVVRNANSVNVKLKSGEIYKVVKIINLEKDKDICIMKIEGFDLPALPFGNSNKVNIGEDCIAIGNPQGLENTVSNGIVSGVRLYNGMNLIQITAPISPGSSGGPLLNGAGEVIGITTLTWNESGSQNLNFAIPINYVRGMMEVDKSLTFADLKDGGKDEGKTQTEETQDTSVDKRYKYVTETENAAIYFDTESINTRVNNKNQKVVEVWIMEKYTVTGIADIYVNRKNKNQKTEGFFSLDFCLTHMKFRPGESSIISYSYFSDDGQSLETISTKEPTFNEILPGTIGEKIYKDVLAYVKANNL